MKKAVLRTVSLVLAVVMLAFCGITASAYTTGKDDNTVPASDIFGESVFYFDTFKVGIDKTKDVALYISSNPGFSSAEITVTCETGIKFEGAKFDGCDITGTVSGNVITFALGEDYTADGKVAILTFSGVSESTPKITVTPTNVKGEGAAEAYDFEAFTAAVEVTLKATVYGDVNGDGKVDNSDLIRLKKYLAGQSVELDSDAADVTADGKVDNSDLIRLKKYLAGQSVKLGE